MFASNKKVRAKFRKLRVISSEAKSINQSISQSIRHKSWRRWDNGEVMGNDMNEASEWHKSERTSPLCQ